MSSKKQIIAIDAMGNDLGPEPLIDGLCLSIKENPSLNFKVFGDEKAIAPLLTKNNVKSNRVELVHCPQVIAMDDKLRAILKKSKESSMLRAIQSVKDNETNACVSLGNTGAQLLLGRKILGMLPSIDKPALTAFWPNNNHPVLFLDVGANVDCNADHLVQFAIMGTAIYQSIYQIERPKCSILNVGEEDGKGHEELTKAANILREHSDLINYTGFCEGNDISLGQTHIVVTDGFSGNIALKTGEGAAKLVANFLKEEIKSSLRSKIAALIMSKELKALKNKLSASNYNGAIFSGLNGIMVKGHGSASAEGTVGAINIAIRLINYDINNIISNFIQKIHSTTT